VLVEARRPARARGRVWQMDGLRRRSALPVAWIHKVSMV